MQTKQLVAEGVNTSRGMGGDGAPGRRCNGLDAGDRNGQMTAESDGKWQQSGQQIRRRVAGSGGSSRSNTAGRIHAAIMLAGASTGP